MESETDLEPNVEVPAEHSPAPKKKTSFVTIAGWVFIGYGAYSALFGVFMLIFFPRLDHLLYGIMPKEETRAFLAIFAFFIENFRGLMIYGLVMALLQIVTGVMLRKRWNAGRILAITLLAVLTIVGIVSLVTVSYGVIGLFHEMGDLAILVTVSYGVGILLGSLPMLGLYVYAIYKFTRPEIRGEFKTA